MRGEMTLREARADLLITDGQKKNVRDLAHWLDHQEKQRAETWRELLKILVGHTNKIAASHQIVSTPPMIGQGSQQGRAVGMAPTPPEFSNSVAEPNRNTERAAT